MLFMSESLITFWKFIVDVIVEARIPKEGQSRNSVKWKENSLFCSHALSICILWFQITCRQSMVWSATSCLFNVWSSAITNVICKDRKSPYLFASQLWYTVRGAWSIRRLCICHETVQEIPQPRSSGRRNWKPKYYRQFWFLQIQGAWEDEPKWTVPDIKIRL